MGDNPSRFCCHQWSLTGLVSGIGLDVTYVTSEQELPMGCVLWFDSALDPENSTSRSGLIWVLIQKVHEVQSSHKDPGAIQFFKK